MTLMLIQGKESRQLAEETKDLHRKLRHRHKLSQKDLEFVLDTDQSNISRWENPQTDQFPPTYEIAVCVCAQDERVRRFGLETLDHLEILAGRTAHPLPATADGKLDDEFRESVEADGDFARIMESGNIEEAELIAKRIQGIAASMLAEVKLAREAKRKQEGSRRV